MSGSKASRVRAIVAAAAGCVLAFRSRQGRLAVNHELGALERRSERCWLNRQLLAGLGTRPAMIASILVAGLAVAAVPVLNDKFGRSFPAGPIAQRAARLGGCLTTDDPTTLIETNLVQSNLQPGCKLVVDLGGYSYDIYPRATVPRSRNVPWQRFAIDYLGSGSAAIVVRFNSGFGLSAHSARVIRGWPVLIRADRFVLRSPDRVGHGTLR